MVITAASGTEARPEHAVLAVLCCPALYRDAADAITRLITTPTFRWGELLEQAIHHKLICLLAAYLDDHGLHALVSRPLLRHLRSTLRANQYKTGVYRAEAAHLAAAFARTRLAIAAVHGITVESTLYGGRGARQLSDLDFLTTADDVPAALGVLADLGYRPTPKTGGASALVRALDDPIVPRIPVDLTVVVGPSRTTACAAMRRRIAQPIPGHHATLPVLAPEDAFLNALARLARRPQRQDHAASPPRLITYADVLRMYVSHRHGLRPAVELLSAADDYPAAAAGWTALLRAFPLLGLLEQRSGTAPDKAWYAEPESALNQPAPP